MMFHRILLSIMSLLLCMALAKPVSAEETTGYVPWGVEEYEFFGLNKTQLAQKFKGKLHFNDDYSRAAFGKQEACHTYDGPTFELGYETDKVTKVQRVFVGCTSTLYGPVFDTKQAALKFAVAGLSKLESKGTLRPFELAKLAEARKTLAGSSGGRGQALPLQQQSGRKG